MKRKIFAVLLALVAILAVFGVQGAAKAGPISVKPAFTTTLVYVQGWDGGCVSYPSVRLHQLVETVPCKKASPWNLISQGSYFYLNVPGIGTTLGDSGGSPALQDQTFLYVVKAYSKSGNVYYAFRLYSIPDLFQQHGTGSPTAWLTFTHTVSVHESYIFWAVGGNPVFRNHLNQVTP